MDSFNFIEYGVGGVLISHYCLVCLFILNYNCLDYDSLKMLWLFPGPWS